MRSDRPAPPKANATASHARPGSFFFRSSTLPRATNSTSVSTSTTDEAMEVHRRDSKYAAKCSPRNAPEAKLSSHSRRAKVRSSARCRRRVQGASSAAENTIRYRASTRDGADDHRTNAADNDTPATPSNITIRFIVRSQPLASSQFLPQWASAVRGTDSATTCSISSSSSFATVSASLSGHSTISSSWT